MKRRGYLFIYKHYFHICRNKIMCFKTFLKNANKIEIESYQKCGEINWKSDLFSQFFGYLN